MMGTVSSERQPEVPCANFDTISGLLNTDLLQEKRLNYLETRSKSLEMEIAKQANKMTVMVWGAGVILLLLIIDILLALRGVLF